MSQRLGKDIECQNCGTLFYKPLRYLKRREHHFCSTLCSNKFFGNRCDKDQTKPANCKNCNKQITIKAQASVTNSLCDTCKKQRKHILSRQKREKQCKDCLALFIGLFGNYCSSCHKRRRSIAGLKSVLSQQRRSKNEIAFHERISSLIEHEIFCNQPIFKDINGSYWDADIIIPALKIAIHWNGPWHYKQISKRISLSQIQNRDELKYKVVSDNGFRNYIIRDDGKYSEEKVDAETALFLQWLKTTANN